MNSKLITRLLPGFFFLCICNASALTMDTDQDGMVDRWEDELGLNKNDPADAQADFDGDGFVNLEEYMAGTEIRNPNSYPSITLITEEQAFAIASKILRTRNAMPKVYEPYVEWATNHWSISVKTVEYDDKGNQIQTIGNKPSLVYLYPNGDLLAILDGVDTSQEELMQWEDNLRQLKKNKP